MLRFFFSSTISQYACKGLRAKKKKKKGKSQKWTNQITSLSLKLPVQAMFGQDTIFFFFT